jgi:DNA polymerase III subunit delta
VWPAVTPSELARELDSGKIRPVYLITGEERVLADRAVQKLRAVAVDAAPDFNEERLSATEVRVGRVLDAARMLPMMAKRRVVIVRGLESWDSKKDAGDGDGANAGADDPSSNRELPPLDRLADYAAAPVASTCLILVASKIDARRRLVTTAKKAGFLVSCEPLKDAALAEYAQEAATARGCRLPSSVADQLVAVVGPELALVLDAVERLALHAGTGATISEETVSEIIVKLRESSVFSLIDAVANRNPRAALGLLDEVFDPRDRGLPLVALLATTIRRLALYEASIRAGESREAAAKAAGSNPHFAGKLDSQVRALRGVDFAQWLRLLAEADQALKGSKRPPQSILETMILSMIR